MMMVGQNQIKGYVADMACFVSAYLAKLGIRRTNSACSRKVLFSETLDME